jgi:protein SCO1
MRNCLMCLVFATFLLACNNEVLNQKLPIYGERRGFLPNGDTIFSTIPDFQFIDQDSQVVNNATFEGKIYVADFFFTSCPTICPKVTAQMLRVHEAFKDSARLDLISHTIDPRHDTIPKLRAYAQRLGVMNAKKWHFVRGTQDSVYAIASNYFSSAKENKDSPGGFDHSGLLVLVDKKRRVRATCYGTEPDDVTRFMRDIRTLLNE